jgi:hypothetical protein
MGTFTINDVRLRAKKVLQGQTLNKSAATVLRSSVSAHTGTQTYDVFLSHSIKDADLILGTKAVLEEHDYSVYVDWVSDPHLDRGQVSKATAQTIRSRMDCCKSLFYTTTPASTQSKWMPWECGYMDGKKGRAAIFPLTQTEQSHFSGQEYLSVYPYITREISNGGKMLLWVCEAPAIYCSFDQWLEGKQPWKH